MAIKTKEELYTYYKAGDKATEGQWFDLIDSLFNRIENGDDLNPYTYNEILFVDAAATIHAPVSGQIIRPYRSPDLARDAASSGDLIVLFPGTYLCGNLFKSGVTYFAFPGVKLIGNPIFGASLTLFSDSSTAAGGTCRLMGYAEIQVGIVATIIKTNTILDIECEKITYLPQGSSFLTPLFSLVGGLQINIKVKQIIVMHSFYYIFGLQGGSVNIDCDIIHTKYSGLIIMFNTNRNGVVWNVNIGKIENELLGGIPNIPVFACTLSPLAVRPQLYIRNAVINAYNFSLITAQGVDVFLEDVRFICKSNVLYPSLYVFNHTHYTPGALGFISIQNCEVIMEHDLGIMSQRVFNPQAGYNYKVIGVLASNLFLNDNTLFTVGEYHYESDFGLN